MGMSAASCLTGAGSTTLPIASLYGGTSGRVFLRSFSVFNTTTSAVSLKLVRVTTAGTQGTALTEMQDDQADVATTAAAFNTHSVAPTITSGDLYRFMLGASVGSGLVVGFDEPGIVIPAIANNGLALVVSAGTGQICEVTFRWAVAG